MLFVTTTDIIKVVKIYDSFVLGFCRCSCGTEINIKKKGRRELLKFVNYHQNRGKNNHFWKRGKIKITGYWYIKKPDHPFANCMGYVAEHRLIYEEYYNCILLPYTELHHINENILDNRIQNLRPLYKGQHTSIHNIGNQYRRFYYNKKR